MLEMKWSGYLENTRHRMRPVQGEPQGERRTREMTVNDIRTNLIDQVAGSREQPRNFPGALHG